jgi:hypothetical protein
MRDFWDRVLGDVLSRRVWTHIRATVDVDLDAPLTPEGLLMAHVKIERELGGPQRLYELTEKARLHTGLPGRN